MRWLRRDRWKACIAVAGLLFVLVFMVWVRLSAHAYEGASVLAMSAPVDTTPPPDLTVTALAKKQLGLQVDQLQSQFENQSNWFANNSTALIAATATVIVALFGIYQWAMNRRDQRRKELDEQDKELEDRKEERRKETVAQDKELRDRAEERFKIAVTSLGDEKESVQVGGAVLLRSFLHEEDKEIYGRYYTQIFDLAVAYLRLSNTSLPPEDTDEAASQSEDSDTSLPLTPLRQALIIVFREVFPLARSQHKDPQALDASGIQLDNAYLIQADLNQAWLIRASLRRASLFKANLKKAELSIADIRESDLREADLSVAALPWANFSRANLSEASLRSSRLSNAILKGANLSEASFEKADLHEAVLAGAIFSETNFNGADLDHADFRDAILDYTDILEADSMFGTDLRGAKGLTKKQLRACKARGAIIDEETKAKKPQQNGSSPTPQQTSDDQASSTPLPEADTP
jgi:uncharacterized protein YjbI with pentapeptide repeats